MWLNIDVWISAGTDHWVSLSSQVELLLSQLLTLMLLVFAVDGLLLGLIGCFKKFVLCSSSTVFTFF